MLLFFSFSCTCSDRQFAAPEDQTAAFSYLMTATSFSLSISVATFPGMLHLYSIYNVMYNIALLYNSLASHNVMYNESYPKVLKVGDGFYRAEPQ